MKNLKNNLKNKKTTRNSEIENNSLKLDTNKSKKNLLDSYPEIKDLIPINNNIQISSKFIY